MINDLVPSEIPSEILPHAKNLIKDERLWVKGAMKVRAKFYCLIGKIMGCDIHMYVEYCLDPNEDDAYWCSIGKVRPGRSYIMFEALAGIRGNLDPIVEPKGLPAKLGFDADYDYYLMVNDKYPDEDHCCSVANADKWVNSGLSTNKFVNTYRWVSGPDWHTPSWLTTEEYEASINLAEKRLVTWFEDQLPKTSAWLEDMRLAAEKDGTPAAKVNYRRMVDSYNQPEKIDVSYKAILAMMKTLPNARLVFWFDN